MTHSETIGAIGAALAKAQAAIQPAAKDAKNPHFGSKYADLASVWDACRAHLTANGIAVVQSPEATDANVTITTLLIHGSGEWVSGSLTVRAKDAGPQSIGSAITYGRRYGLASMVGVAPDDDDAEAATERKSSPSVNGTKHSPSIPTYAPPLTQTVISDAQRKRLYTVATKAGWQDADVKKLLALHGFASSKDITPAKYDAIVSAIETGDTGESVVPF